MRAQAPLPIQGESCEAFCIRAHRQMMATEPSAAARNRLVWDAWDMMHPTPEKYAATEKFAAYRHVPAVCHFAEHTINTRGGPFTVGPGELTSICQNLNRRIREVGLYSALVDKHTGDKQADEPLVIGYAGCFRIGMIGDQEQKFAIFGDEYHKPKYQKIADEKPRRSVELMRYADSRRNFFDPIACLGADSPRLEIPPAYYGAIEDEGVVVERYSIMAPASGGALPGGSNTYLPGEREDYQADQSQQTIQTQGSTTMLSPEDVNQIISAIANAIEPRLAALESFMKGGQQPAAQPGALPGAQPGQLPGQPNGQPNAASPAGDPAAGGSPAPAGDPLSLAGGASPTAQRDQYALPALAAAAVPALAGAAGAAAGKMMGGSGKQDYSANSDPEHLNDDLPEGGDIVTTEKYSQEFVDQLIHNHEQLIAETGQLRATVGKLLHERTDAQRAYRLQQLAQKYSAIEANLDEEMERVLYSAGAKMTDEEFDAHCATIERYAAQASPPREMIPEGQIPGDSPAKELYSQEFNDEVVRRCSRMLASGKVASYDQVANELAKERGIAA